MNVSLSFCVDVFVLCMFGANTTLSDFLLLKLQSCWTSVVPFIFIAPQSHSFVLVTEIITLFNLNSCVLPICTTKSDQVSTVEDFSTFSCRFPCGLVDMYSVCHARHREFDSRFRRLFCDHVLLTFDSRKWIFSKVLIFNHRSKVIQKDFRALVSVTPWPMVVSSTSVIFKENRVSVIQTGGCIDLRKILFVRILIRRISSSPDLALVTTRPVAVPSESV